MNKQAQSEDSSRRVPFDKVLFVFLVVINIIAILTFYEFNTIIIDVLAADVIMVAILKAEQVARLFLGTRVTIARMQLQMFEK